MKIVGVGKLATFQEDMRAVFDRDPAARSWLEVVLTYPGLHAVWGYRVSHWLWKHNLKLLGRWFSTLVRFFTGIEIHPAAKICHSLFIDHGMGVVIGETAEIGCNVTLYHGVTLGGVSLKKGKRHPTIEDNVVIGAGAKVLGAITVGEGSRIGSNAVVVKDVPPNSVVVGVPGQVVVRSHPSTHQPDFNHNMLPDTIGVSLEALMERVSLLEKKLHVHVSESPVSVYSGEGSNGNGKSSGNGNGNGNGKGNGNGSGSKKEEHIYPHAPDHGLWRGEDFMI